MPIFVWNVPLVSLIFLKRSLDFPILSFYSIPCIDHWGRFFYISLLFFGTLFRWIYLSFSPLPSSSLLFFSQLYVLVSSIMLDSWDPMDYNLPGSSIHGIFQTRILLWTAISFSRGSSWPLDWTHISALAGRFFTTEWSGKPSTCSWNKLFPPRLWDLVIGILTTFPQSHKCQHPKWLPSDSYP